MLLLAFGPAAQIFSLSWGKAQAATQCSAGYVPLSQAHLYPRVGGVALDQAAVFLADMSDVTGAYYDSTQDRIVFIGQKQTSVPKFDKDDLAVAIRALLFKNAIPAVSMEFKDPTNPYGDPNMKALYYGGIEDTSFGKTLIDADYKLKMYIQGYDQNQQKVVSTVPGFKSHFDRFLEKNPDPNKSSTSRWWISPKEVVLKRDSATNSFVFDRVSMQVQTQPLSSNNDPAWNQAASEFSQHQTTYYDQYATETQPYFKAKQLSKITAIIKWLRDNNIASDFSWAREYQPTYVATPKEIPRLTTPWVSRNGVNWNMTGGVDFNTPNTYNIDDGSAVGLKTAAQAVSTTPETNHWTFTKDGQQYEAVAVSASALRSLGAYNTQATDFSFETTGELDLTLQRAYSSFSGGQYGFGRGWDVVPARLYNNRVGWGVNCPDGNVGWHVWKIGFQTQDGLFETFTYTSCANGFSADNPGYHSKVFDNADGTFTVRLVSQVEYIFDSSFRLIRIKDKNANVISYNYDSSGRLNSIADSRGHQLNLSYNSSGLLTATSDWAARSTQYGYDAQGNLTTVKDPLNGTTTYTYDTNNKLVKVTNRLNEVVLENTYTADFKLATQKDASGKISTFSYDEPNSLISISDNLGRTTKAKYDSKARVLEQTDPLNQKVTYTYGNEFSPLTIKDRNNNQLTYAYNAQGKVSSVTFPNLKRITYEYDAKNNLTRILDYRYGTTPKETKFTYDALGNLQQQNEASRLLSYTYDTTGEVASLTNHLNKKINFTRNNFGEIATITDPLTNLTTNEYDAVGRLTKVTDPDGKIFTFTYDANNNLIKKINAFGEKTHFYDAENRLQKIQEPNTAITEFTYNPAGMMTGIKDALMNNTTYGYDSSSNLTAQTDALNRTTTHFYNELNREVKSVTPLGKETKWEFDPNGNITKRIDAANRSVIYQYDNLNRLQTITYPDTRTVNFTYDDRGNVVQMVDPIGTTTYVYDIFNRLTSVTNPYSQVISYTYDAVGNLTHVTYPDNKIVQYGYDENNRLSFVTDWNNQQTTYVYTKNGLLDKRQLPNGIITQYAYDAANRLSSLTHKKGLTQLAQYAYQRDSLGNITQVIENSQLLPPPSPVPSPSPSPLPSPSPSPSPFPTPSPSSSPSPVPSPTPQLLTDLIVSGVSLTSTTPAVNAPISITATLKNQSSVGTGKTRIKVGFYYDRSTPPTTNDRHDDVQTLTNGLAAGQELTVLQDAVKFTTPGKHLIWVLVDRSNSVSESNEGNNYYGPVEVNVGAQAAAPSLITRVATDFTKFFRPAQVYAQVQTRTVTVPFTYDLLGRVKTAVFSEGKNYAYDYDKVGNRVTQTVNGAPSTHTYNNDNQLTQVGSTIYSYDANGNVLQVTANASSKNFAYDFDNRLTSQDSTTFTYDGAGRRLKKTSDSSSTRYVNDINGPLEHVVAETDNSNAIFNYFVRGNDLISEGPASAANRVYFLDDGLGNVRYLANADGDLVNSYDYDAFGNSTGVNESVSNNYRFIANPLDQETGLYFLRARYYDPEVGRFISRDPVQGVLSMPQTQNAYPYSLNNPIMLSDPSGEWALGGCVGGNYGVGWYTTCSACLVYASDGQVGTTFSTGGGGTTGIASGVGASLLMSSASNLNQMGDIDIFVGGSAWWAGADASFSADDRSIWAITPGVSIGPDISPPALPGEFHGGATHTWLGPSLGL